MNSITSLSKFYSLQLIPIHPDYQISQKIHRKFTKNELLFPWRLKARFRLDSTQ